MANSDRTAEENMQPSRPDVVPSIQKPVVKYFFAPYCAPCRSVLMLGITLDIVLERRYMLLHAYDNFQPDFLAINPQHTLPTVIDGGLVLWQPHAILIYFVEKYGKDDSLYPKCPQQQAIINQRLYFDMCTLYLSFENYFDRHIKRHPAMYKQIEIAFGFLNTFLEGHAYTAGDALTIADFAMLATVSNFDVAGFNFGNYANVKRWYEHCKTIVPGWVLNWQWALLLKYFLN